MAQVLGQFDRQRGGPELREELALARAESWDRALPGEAATGAWRAGLQALGDYIAPLLADPAYHVDPFADHAAFPVYFKIFHGLANQLGLDATNEAFLYHCLTGVAGQADLRDRPVRLRPAL